MNFENHKTKIPSDIFKCFLLADYLSSQSAAGLHSLAPEVHPAPVLGAALHPCLRADVQVALLHRGARVPGDPRAAVGGCCRLVMRGKSCPHGTKPGTSEDSALND